MRALGPWLPCRRAPPPPLWSLPSCPARGVDSTPRLPQGSGDRGGNEGSVPHLWPTGRSCHVPLFLSTALPAAALRVPASWKTTRIGFWLLTWIPDQLGFWSRTFYFRKSSPCGITAGAPQGSCGGCPVASCLLHLESGLWPMQPSGSSPFSVGWGCSRTRQAPVPEGLPSVVGTVT